jgi:2-dehydropantoate 2-reductase
MGEIFVVGAGGIGCALGYALRSAGAELTFVEADGGKVAWGRARGVRVNRRPPLEARFTTFEEWTPQPGDTVLLCTKCYDNAEVLARLPCSTTLIPIQNGFDPLLEARDHNLEGIASFVSECEPGRPHTWITRSGRLHIGHRYPADKKASFDLAVLLRRGRLFPTVCVGDILPFKYAKLMYNAAIGPVASVAGIDNGGLLGLKKARRIFFALLRENYGILRHAGIQLAKIGLFHPDSVDRILRRRALADSLAWAFYPSLRGSYCSMSGDLPKGRTEIDYYNGRLIRLAGDYPCPVNRQVYDLVKRMERDRTRPGLGMLEEISVAGLPAPVRRSA